MSYGLFGSEYPFLGLFTRQYAILRECARCLDAIFRGEGRVAEQCQKIQALNNESDQIHREVARALALTFIKPFDRDDIHELNQAFEAAVESIRAVSSRIGLYGFAGIKPPARELADDLRGMVEEIAPMMEKLVMKGGIEESRARARKVKTEADLLLLVALGELYEAQPGGGRRDMLDVVKWTQVYDRMETAIAAVDHVMNRIESIVLKKV